LFSSDQIPFLHHVWFLEKISPFLESCRWIIGTRHFSFKPKFNKVNPYFGVLGE